MKLYNILLLLFSPLFSVLVYADPQTQAQPPNLVQKLTHAERDITKKVNSLSNEIDSFFSREEIESETSESRLRVGYAINLIEYEDPEYNFILSAQLVLPKTQKKLQLLVLSDEKDLFERREISEVTPDSKIKNSVENQKFNLGLRGLLHKSKTSAVTLDGGVRLRRQLDLFVRFGARRSIFFDDYELRLTDRTYWFKSEGWTTSPAIDLDRTLNPVWLARFSNNGTLDHESGLWQFDHFLAFYQKLNSRTIIGYSAGITSDNERTLALQSYYAVINYRYALIPNWLYFQVVPRLTWPREQNWQKINSILFKIESVFGG